MQRRTTTRRWARGAVALAAALMTGTLLAPAASATPADDARQRVERAAQQLTVLDEQVHQAELAVADQQRTAAEAQQRYAEAEAAVAVYEPQLRAIAQTGYADPRSRMAAFLTSDSADDLVQQLTTLDVIAARTNAVLADAARAKAAAEEAKTAADAAVAQADAGLAQLQQQKAQIQQQADQYRADFAQLSAAEQAAVTTAVAGPSLPVPSTGAVLAMAPNQAIAAVLKAALSKIGAAYEYGSMGPDTFDCSGFTHFAYLAAGVDLVHSSAGQSTLGQPVDRADLRPGDLVFFYSPISHVGLYIGNGMMVHARTYGRPVAVVSVDQPGYRFGRRIIPGD